MDHQKKLVRESVSKRLALLESSNQELMKIHEGWTNVERHDPNVVKYLYVLFTFSDYNILNYVEEKIICKKSRNLELMVMGSMEMIIDPVTQDVEHQRAFVVDRIKERLNYLMRKKFWQQQIIKKYNMLNIEDVDVTLSLNRIFETRREEDILAFELIVLHPWFLPFETSAPLEHLQMKRHYGFTNVQVGALTYKKPEMESLPAFCFAENSVYTAEDSGFAFDSFEKSFMDFIEETATFGVLLRMNREYTKVFEVIQERYIWNHKEVKGLSDRFGFTFRKHEEMVINSFEKDENMLSRLSAIRFLSGPQFVETISKQSDGIIKELLGLVVERERQEAEQKGLGNEQAQEDLQSESEESE